MYSRFQMKLNNNLVTKLLMELVTSYPGPWCFISIKCATNCGERIFNSVTFVDLHSTYARVNFGHITRSTKSPSPGGVSTLKTDSPPVTDKRYWVLVILVVNLEMERSCRYPSFQVHLADMPLLIPSTQSPQGFVWLSMKLQVKHVKVNRAISFPRRVYMIYG